MSSAQRLPLFLLRLSLGWLFLYAGLSKVLNPAWSAEGFLRGAKTFPEFYAWFAQPDILPLTNLLNEWGLTILGALLIFGIGVRLASLLGIVMMALYYFPSLSFPYAGEHAYLVDDHLIYAAALWCLLVCRAGRAWGLEQWAQNLSLVSRSALLRRLLS